MPITLYPHKTRVITFYSHEDKNVPTQAEDKNDKNFCINTVLPLPVAKKDITAVLQCNDVFWLASNKGLVRYCENEKYDFDKVMYFSADRDLKDNTVLALQGSENEVWVKTETAVSHIELKVMSMEEKANLLLDESLNIVDRMGMISQRGLMEPWDTSKPKAFTNSDNDGGFTAAFCLGELFHYAVLRKEKGADDPETVRIRKVVIRSLEACLLLWFIHGRNDGFLARTYITTADPLPDDGLFLRKQNGKATVLPTSFSNERGYAGMECDASAPVPDRLAKLYRDEGFTDDDIIFKGDTSSDETTLHLIFYYFAHEILGYEDTELDELMKTAITGFIDHVTTKGYEFIDFHGKSTSWGKWSENYFSSGLGWADAPLNANEMLLYLKLATAVCGEKESWTKAHDMLIEKGYHLLAPLHYDRFFAASLSENGEVNENLMYGDHMLANITFFGLAMLEKDEKLAETFRKGWMTWRNTSISREHHPVYDLPFKAVHPEEEIDEEKIKMWFYRYNSSSLASAVSLTLRRDIAAKEHMGGYLQTSWLLPPDERPISKYDRDSLHYVNEESGGKYTVETSAPFTLPYWLGRYFGLITEGGNS